MEDKQSKNINSIDEITEYTANLYYSINQQNRDNPLPESYLNLFKRIIYSRWNVYQTNESEITNSILDKVEKLYKNNSENLEKIERMQSLYSRLTKKRFPTKRWACLYILDGLSKLNNANNINFKTTNILDTMNKLNSSNYEINKLNEDINMINTIKSNKGDINMVDLENKIQNSNIKNPSPIVVDVNRTTKIITEKDLINDLMYVFQGIDGHYITYNIDKDMFCLNNIIPWNEDIFDIVYSLCELGWLYKKVNDYLNFFNESNIPSQYIQSFSYAVQNELNEYYKLISFFKRKNEQSKNESNIDYLSFKNLVLWTTEPIERMRWIASSCESVFSLRGAAIISQIYSYVNYSGGEIYLNKVLEEISKPLYTFIKNWLEYGELQDPYKEFFVDILDKINDDDLWTLQYQLVYKNIPNFISRELVIKIFEVGKCIHFIRKYCGENGYSLFKIKDKLYQQIEQYQKNIKDKKEEMDIEEEKNSNINNVINQNKDKDINQGQIIDINSYNSCLEFLNYLGNSELEKVNKNEGTFLVSLMNHIDLLHSLVNKDLIDLFYNKFHFKENLNSINRYLLLGQGDMMQSLMESLFEELKKPANHIYKHNLQANLEAAIRASNAQFNDQECLKKLNIKLMDASSGDTGWDIFLLEYNVEVPLTVVFTKSLLKEYQKLFFFFWKLKRLEYSQNHQIWRKFMTYSHSLKQSFDYMRKVLQRSMLFNQQVIHFVSNLHNFLALEVLETQYKKLLDELIKVKTLDDLINVHKKFVDNVINQSLLNMENNGIYKKILEIFELIIRFRAALDVLITTFLEGHYQNINNDFDMENSNNNFKQFSNEASNQISNYFEKFKTEVTDLINSIEYFGKGNMKYLGMKLDYNNYYSKLKKENENRQQLEMIDKINKEEELKRQISKQENEEEEDNFYNNSSNNEHNEQSGLDEYEKSGNFNYGQSNNDINKEEIINTDKKTYELYKNNSLNESINEHGDDSQ